MPALLRQPLRQPLPGRTATGPVVVAVGRLTPEKRLRELSEHWHLVRAEHPDVTLVIVGIRGHNVDPGAVQLAEDSHVVHLGVRDDIENVYRAAYMYVSASVAEGLRTLSSKRWRRVCLRVVTATGGVADVIQNGRNGLVVPPDDMACLITAINTLLADPNLARGSDGAPGRPYPSASASQRSPTSSPRSTTTWPLRVDLGTGTGRVFQ